MTETGNRQQKKGTRFSAAKIMLFASVVILAVIMPTCVVPGGISINFVNPGGDGNYTLLTFGSQSVNGGNLTAGASYLLQGVSTGSQQISGNSGAGPFTLEVTVNVTDTEDTYTGPPSNTFQN